MWVILKTGDAETHFIYIISVGHNPMNVIRFINKLRLFEAFYL